MDESPKLGEAGLRNLDEFFGFGHWDFSHLVLLQVPRFHIRI